MMIENDKKAKRCPQCGKEITTPVSCEIIYRTDGRVNRDKKEFCSTVCGGNYQMGCEG